MVDFKLREKDLEALLKSEEEHKLVRTEKLKVTQQLQEARDELSQQEKQLY